MAIGVKPRRLFFFLTSDIPVKKKKKSIHIVSGAKFAAKCPFSPNTTVTKPSKSSSESESSVHCCRAAVKTRQNSKEWSLKLDQNETILPELRDWKSPTCAEIICDHCRKRPQMQRHRFMCPITETMEHGVENLRWRSSLKPVEAGVSGRLGSRYRAP